MIKKSYTKLVNYLKSSLIYKLFSFLYDKIVKLLSLHKGIPNFLAHGGLHLIILLFLSCIVIQMIIYLKRSYVASFNQIVYSFYGDTLNNYKLNYLAFDKDMTRRPDNTYNQNDIILSYGFVKDSVETNRMIPLNFIKSYKDTADLVSVVKYLTVNGIPDTLLNLPKNKYSFVLQTNQLISTEKVTNHERYYYSLSTLRDSMHIFHRITNAKDHLVDWGSLNPYFSFWIGINIVNNVELNRKSFIRIRVNNTIGEDSEDGIQEPLVLDRIIPEPTTSNINEIVFKGEELKSVIKQKGIYISGIDPIKKEEQERKNLYVTVYLGTIIAFMLDIIVHLVLKWINLNKNSQDS